MSEKNKSLPVRLFDLLSSFGLAVIILSFLLLITFLGTLAQKDMGLLDSQRLYFDSWGLIHDFKIYGVVLPVPLPGGGLLMVLLFFNMLCGAVIRIRKGWRTVGVLISHLAIMFMLVAGFVSFLYKTEGAMPLFEGQASDQYQSYHERIIEVRRFDASGKGDETAMVIPMNHFADLSPGKARDFFAKDMPFEIQVTGYQRNANIVQAGEEESGVIDGYRIQAVKHAKEDEANVSAVEILVKSPGAPQKAILWEGAFAPYTVKAGDSLYTIALARMKWKLPFAIRLEDFQRELHPGTMKAKKYTSHITKITNGKEDPMVVTMNVPVRDQGYVVYQASFSSGANGEQSVFTVASNPSDQWPLWSCVAVAAGLLIHFVMHFIRFLNRALKPKAA
ncbi:ResB-like family protein [Prosthecobacter fusiformis]|uniref:ResB-like family protein n=1 Tax=Prosthecobacter fusiformis TaxID=48464 RepID=A0A4R7S4G0_9BACT|nr:cytochrome c biogenesis protein ResB [Prosthecobacter fusiformis]TDU73214.1 ResB-like family protein [Prosthecobacter fusiformis]